MPRYTRTVAEKLETKISGIRGDDRMVITSSQVKIGRRILFRYSPLRIDYTKVRYFPSMKDDVVEEDFSATILLTHATLSIVSGNICNPPRGAKQVLDMVRHVEPTLNKIIIGSDRNRIERNSLYITYDLYDILVSINREESKDKVTRVRNRVGPFLQDSYGLESTEASTPRDYGLLLNEIIASRSFSQADILAMTRELDSGEINEVVIEKQINKQAKWLLEAIDKIIEETDLTTEKAKNLGSSLFGFSKASISGPEDLMEQILTKYGQHIIFGVPALLNIDKFIISSTGFPRSQFDIVLVNHLSDIEIVELKRTDEYLLDYDSSRGKFYMSRALSVATAQCERYISAIYKEHDTELTIEGKTIREYISDQLGGVITLSICRPRALIVIGALHRIVKPYQELSATIRAKVSKQDYINNSDTAYKEIKASFKNTDIVTYSELVEGARLRLQLATTDETES